LKLSWSCLKGKESFEWLFPPTVCICEGLAFDAGQPTAEAKLKNKSKNMIKSQIETRLPEQMNGRDLMFIASTSRQAFANTFVSG
jgi:hypothetical protein